MVTKAEIRALLERCGISNRDKVAIHTSLRATGPIEGGADGLIDGFCDHLTDGLLLIPTHTWATVNRENPFYDVKATAPCIGTLAHIAAFRPDAMRSLHPIHSVAAFGRGAADYVKGEERAATPAPVGSCLSRLYEEHGKILLIGVGHDRNTYLHSVDERLGIPDRISPEGVVYTIRDWDGNLIQGPEFHTYYTAASPVSVSEYYPNYADAFDYAGVVRHDRLGNAEVLCCDARGMTEVVRQLWAMADRDLCISHWPIPASMYQKVRL